jgi:hypothetical protein
VKNIFPLLDKAGALFHGEREREQAELAPRQMEMDDVLSI